MGDRAETEKSAAAIRRLLRFLAAGPAQCRSGGKGGPVTLRQPAGAVRNVDRRLLRAVVSAGLVVERGGTVMLDAPGRNWLKRALAEGDAFQAQHRDLVTPTGMAGGEATAAMVNAAESPLSVLRRLKSRNGAAFLSEHVYDAGERLRRDFERGRMMPRISANWQASVSSRGRRAPDNGLAELTDAALAARQRVERALDAVGPELAGVLIDACCFLKGMETIERERQWPVRSGKVMVRAALTALARHYEPPAKERMRQSHVWTDEGFRPQWPLPGKAD